jgi:hypothetical protein
MPGLVELLPLLAVLTPRKTRETKRKIIQPALISVAAVGRPSLMTTS